MKEKMVRLSQLNLSGLLESSIKSVENDFKEKYLNENESLSDYGFNRNDIINSYIEIKIYLSHLLIKKLVLVTIFIY